MQILLVTKVQFQIDEQHKPLKTLSEAIPSPFQYQCSTIYCQAHTGQLGRNNRNRGGVDRVNKDWKVMCNGMNI